MLPALYHAHHSLHMEDLAFWLELASQAGDPILELGCGTGRVLTSLILAGHACLGLDNDLAMLKFLQASQDKSQELKPWLLAADIRRFSLAQRFPLIILPCNTFSMLDAAERSACLDCVRAHLKPGGMFAVSLSNPEIWSRLASRPDLEYEEEFILPKTGNPVQVSSAWRRTKLTFQVTWAYDQLYPDGTVERVTMQAVHWRNPPKTYVDEIQSAGMDIINVFGDFDRSPYAVDSPNLIIMAMG
jgi:SAM-dependent methyltransferase